MEVNVDTQTVAGGAAASVLAIAGLRKLYLDWMKSRPEVASANAVEAQFKSLRAQIEAQDARIQTQDQKISMLTSELARQDGVIHKQQQKVTRTEMLLRQFVGLVQDHGTPVPSYMQKEVDDLLNQES